MYLMGADRLGRDMLSRMIYGTRISMSIGLVGVAISLILGVLLGGISGFYGGLVDNLIQRVIEFLRSIPTIPLWMGLAAALPMNWPPEYIYFGITVIISLIGWTGLARVVRGRFLAMREEEFVMAAGLDGASEMRIILRYMVPSFFSHIIASTTLAIPAMILAETSLSFLGLGLRPPVVSWGVLLKDAQSVRSVLQAPWQLWPAAAVVIAVLALNFLGDGLRDAADPYSR
jgi:peptide/nickel transport system permease protein